MLTASLIINISLGILNMLVGVAKCDKDPGPALFGILLGLGIATFGIYGLVVR